jgi:hypothetical protein
VGPVVGPGWWCSIVVWDLERAVWHAHDDQFLLGRVLPEEVVVLAPHESAALVRAAVELVQRALEVGDVRDGLVARPLEVGHAHVGLDLQLVARLVVLSAGQRVGQQVVRLRETLELLDGALQLVLALALLLVGMVAHGEAHVRLANLGTRGELVDLKDSVVVRIAVERLWLSSEIERVFGSVAAPSLLPFPFLLCLPRGDVGELLHERRVENVIALRLSHGRLRRVGHSLLNLQLRLTLNSLRIVDGQRMARRHWRAVPLDLMTKIRARRRCGNRSDGGESAESDGLRGKEG